MRHRQKASNAACQLLRKTSDWDDVAALRLDTRLTLVGPVLATCRAPSLSEWPGWHGRAILKCVTALPTNN